MSAADSDASPELHISRDPSGLSSSSQAGARRDGIWLGLSLVVVAGLVAVALWAHGAIRASVRGQLQAGLGSLLEARVSAVDSWFEDQLRVARGMASHPDLARALNQEAPTADLQGWVERERHRFGFDRLALFDLTGMSLASSGGVDPSLLPHVLERARQGRPSVVPLLELPTATGRARIVGIAVPVFASAPGQSRSEVRAVLGLAFEPKRFTALLAPGEALSEESFVFDRDARLLSPSRFEDELREVGLLEADQSSALHVLLRDPGGDLAAGHVRPAGDPMAWPATAMAARATSRENGIDIDGYRSYLGREVVGAWHWFPDYEFGLAVEFDLDAAYAPLTPLGWVCAALISLLLAFGAGLLGSLFHSRRLGSIAQAARRRAEKLGQYTLEDKIGEGGMSEVYRARHVLMRRPTAVKLLRPERTGSKALERFEREVRQTSRLSHPNTISIYDYGRTSDGTFFYAMELISGLTLNELVATEGPLSEGRVIYLLSQLCGSLEEAHGLGLVHRDIKPSNVLVCARAGLYDWIKVLDFGLVKDVVHGDVELTREGTLTGTPQYLSPEAIRNPASVDARSDLYAVGCVAYFLLTGRPVFQGTSLPEVIAAHLEGTPEPPSQHRSVPLGPELESLVLECLAKDPAARPASAGELVRRLASLPQAWTWGPVEAHDWWQGQGADDVAIRPLPTPHSSVAANGGSTATAAHPAP